MAAPLLPGSAVVSGPELVSLRQLVGAIPDPEIPVLTLDDLGIVRDLSPAADGHLVVKLTPTYSGCPAIDPIRDDVARAVHGAGYADAEVVMALAPAWSTDWITAEGRRKLREYGIAPPEPPVGGGCPLAGSAPVACPHCGSTDTRIVSRFAATPCQAQRVCNSCLEPFHQFKTLR